MAKKPIDEIDLDEWNKSLLFQSVQWLLGRLYLEIQVTEIIDGLNEVCNKRMLEELAKATEPLNRWLKKYTGTPKKTDLNKVKH